MGEYLSFIGVDFWTALFTLLNFLAVFFAGRHYLWGPVMKIIQDRQQEIDHMYCEADSARSNAKAMEQAYKTKLSAAAQTSEQLVKEAVARGQAREEAIIRQAHAEAAAILDKAAADIALEKKKAINDAKDEISGIAMAIAEKVVGRQLNQADQIRMADSFIHEFGEQL